MSKYQNLNHHLNQRLDAVKLSFSEIEAILNQPLPKSARRYSAWWSNNANSHVQASAWIEAGFLTSDLDLAAETVHFVPAQPTGFGERKQLAYKSTPRPGDQPTRHPVWGIWKERMTLQPDVDYTEPADPDWGKVYEQ